MSQIREKAEQFFDTLESGAGWEGCQSFCHPGATFSCQAAALAEVTTVEAYAEWVKGLFTPFPDIHPEKKAFSADDERNSATVYAVIHGTHTADGGPVPPTGKTVAADYVYVMEFDGGLIRHMTKIWNDGYTFQQAGWA